MPNFQIRVFRQAPTVYMGILNSTVAISRARFRAPCCGTAELVGACPNASSGQCSTCSELVEELAECETKLAKSEAERDQAVAERDQAVMERDEAAVELAERDAEKLSLKQRVHELERNASRNSFNSGKPPPATGWPSPPPTKSETGACAASRTGFRAASPLTPARH